MKGILTDLTAERLREVLSYDADTGKFIWIKPASNRVKTGMDAGRIHKVRGYREINIDGERYQAHRLAWLYVHGEWPVNVIDHINHDRLDNRICNLRDIPQADNLKNRKGPARQNKLGVLGVHAHQGGYRAKIQENGKRICLGVFGTVEEASAAFQAAVRKYRSHLFGETA